jgi:DNA-directed RNA polymerase specialized sigma24 family protein
VPQAAAGTPAPGQAEAFGDFWARGGTLGWASVVVLDEQAELSGGAVDPEAEGFARFVVARERALQRTAVLLTGDWALAEDLVQTALARAWPRWERISQYGDPELYVRRVMVNTWATWWRRKWRGERASAAVPDGPALGDVAAEGHRDPDPDRHQHRPAADRGRPLP